MEAQVEQALEQAIRLQAQVDSDELPERKSLSITLKVQYHKIFVRNLKMHLLFLCSLTKFVSVTL